MNESKERVDLILDLAETCGRRFERPGAVRLLLAAVEQVPTATLEKACQVYHRKHHQFSIPALIEIVGELETGQAVAREVHRALTEDEAEEIRDRVRRLTGAVDENEEV